jgi:hypothetical protein
MLKNCVFLFSLLLSISLSGQINSVTYDFETLTAGSAIAGQDNWQYMGNLNTSSNVSGSASCNIPSGPAPTDIVNTVTSGLYVGGKALRNPGNTGSSHVRKYSYKILFLIIFSSLDTHLFPHNYL